MTTPNGSAVDSGKVEKLAVSKLEQRLRIGTDAEIKEVVDYSRMMEIVMASVPSTVEVRWVGINNSQQIERHLANGYEYVHRDDGIVTVSGLETTDASGRYIVVGDCVLMACSKESFKNRQKQIAEKTRNRLDSTIRGDEFQEQLNQRGLKVYKEDERMGQVKS